MDIYNTPIHVVIGKYTVRHICHVFDLTESVQCDLAVDAFVAFRCAVLMPGRLDETGGNGIDCDAFWLKFLYQGSCQKMDGCLGDSIYKGGRIRLLSCIGTGKEHTSTIMDLSSFTINTGTERLVFTIRVHSSKL